MIIIKRVLFIFLLLLTLGFATLWLWSWTQRSTWNFIRGSSSYHVAAAQGVLSITIFSTVAEVDDLRVIEVQLWRPAIGTAVGAAIGGGLLVRARRRRGSRGFPVNSSTSAADSSAVPHDDSP